MTESEEENKKSQPINLEQLTIASQTVFVFGFIRTKLTKLSGMD